MISKSNGVTIGTKHSYTDFGLIMTSKTVSAPEIQTKYIDVDGRNGSIDMSEVLTGNVRFKNRTLTLEFVSALPAEQWSALQSTLQGYIQGNKLKFIFDDDEAFYWLGRASVEVTSNGQYATVSLTATVDPYKYSVATTIDEWLWDPFDFEQDVINYSANLQVDGTLTHTIIAKQKWENPVIVSSVDGITVTFGGVTKTLKQGSQVVYDFIMTEGDNTFTFNGNGVVSIIYAGGSL